MLRPFNNSLINRGCGGFGYKVCKRFDVKTPISYYGGKQNLISEILPLIPDHQQYVEPFCGGAALFWAKKPSPNEAINDSDERVANFWMVLQTDFDALQKRIQSTLHHESSHKKAKQVLQQPMTDPIEYAWAFWVQTQMSFSFRLFGGFRFSNGRGEGRTLANSKEGLKIDFYERIRGVTIFCRDAIELIEMKGDDPDTFMYLDPPYAESDCGHYEDKKDVYYRLLEALPGLKCKWLLSSYPSSDLAEFRERGGLYTKDIEQSLSVSGKHNVGKVKTECLTWNYKIPKKQLSIF